jgi:hypothetical protein
MKTTFLATAHFFLLALGAVSLHAGEVEFPGSVPVLLSNQSVRKDLALTKPQAASLDRIRADYKSDARRVTAKSPGSAVERKAANETLQKINTRYNAAALKVLTPDQRQRLDQIGHRTLGGLMLLVPRIQQKLQLSKAQISALENLRGEGDAFVGKVNRAFEEGEIGLHERLESLRVWRIKQSAKILRVLTPAQKDSLRQLQGQVLKPA